MASITRDIPDRVRGLRRARLPSVLGPLLVLVVLCIVVTLISPRFFSPLNLSNLARQSSILIMLSLGVYFIIMMGGIDLSIEGIMAISSVVVAYLVLSIKNENSLGVLGILIAIAVATLMGFFNGIIHTRLRIPSFMTTLGMLSVGLGLATWLSGGIDIRILDPTLNSWAKEATGPIPNLTFFAAAVVLLALFLEKYTRFGRYIRAIGGAEDRAKLAGIPVDRYKVLAFTIAGMFYGIGGVLNSARIGAGTASVGLGQLFAAITAVVVGGTALTGGTGSVLQTVIGALIVIVIGNGMVMAGVHNYIQLAVHGVIITIAVTLTLDRSKIPIIK